jgi:hypothetical protein
VSGNLYLKINFAKGNIEKIQKKMVPILQEHEKGLDRGLFHPTSHGRLDELRDYLEVFVLNKQGLTINDIIRRFNPSDEKAVKNAAVKDKFYTYRENARRIMKNVENGQFPGRYKKRKANPRRKPNS